MGREEVHLNSSDSTSESDKIYVTQNIYPDPEINNIYYATENYHTSQKKLHISPCSYQHSTLPSHQSETQSTPSIHICKIPFNIILPKVFHSNLSSRFSSLPCMPYSPHILPTVIDHPHYPTSSTNHKAAHFAPFHYLLPLILPRV